MYLSEEYFRRHSLIVPVVKHINQGSVFLRPDQGLLSWHIMTIKFHPDERHPGYYQIRHMKPRHDGMEQGDYFQVVDSFDLDWDKYEEYFLQLPVRMRPLKSIKETKQVALAGWEMFAYVCDSALSKFAMQESFFNSLNTDLPLPERFKGFQEASALLMQSRADCFQVWREQIIPYLRQYCYWLAVLLEGKDAH